MSLPAVLAAWAVLKVAFGPLICDDAYITLGHARGWVEGLGPVMSARNPVCATSTPLYTALLALESLLLRTRDFEALAYATNVLADLAGILLIHRIAARGLRLPAPFPALAAAAYALSANLLAVSAYGMEAPLYAALALAGAWLRFFSPRPFPLLAAVCLLAACIRPEGGLVAVCLILAGWRLDRGHPRRLPRAAACLLAAAAGFLLFLAFYRHAYGQWLPHSVVAKRAEIRVGLLDGLWSWAAHLVYKGPTFGGRTAATLANLAILAAALAGFPRRRSLVRPFPFLLLLWPLLYAAFFLGTRSSHILFSWYYLPVLPFLALTAAHGLARIAEGRVSTRAAHAVGLLLVAWVCAQTFLQDLPGKHRLLKQAREGRYKAAAEVLDARAAESPAGPAPVVLIDEVGTLAYFSRSAAILDSHGLLSPEALPFLGPGTGEAYWNRLSAMRRALRPDWIVGLREASMEGRFHPGEEALYAGYRTERVLRHPRHGWNLEMWIRADPEARVP